MSEKTLDHWYNHLHADELRMVDAHTTAAVEHSTAALRASLAQAEERVRRARADAILEVAKMALEQGSFIMRSAQEMAERLNEHADAQELIHNALLRAEGARRGLHDFSDMLDPLITAALSEARMPGKGA